MCSCWLLLLSVSLLHILSLSAHKYLDQISRCELQASYTIIIICMSPDCAKKITANQSGQQKE